MDTEFLINADLDGDTFTYHGNEIGILLLHGFRATTAEVRLLANALKQKGYTIHAPLLTGHGISPEVFSKTPYTEWLKDAEQSYLYLSTRCNKIFVAGESLGALLALHLASVHKEISAVICFSPAIIVKKIWLSLFLQFVIKELPRSNTRDNLPWKGYATIPTKATVQLFKMQRFTRSKLREITTPLCIFIGKKDRRISLDSGRYILDRVNAADAEIHYYPDSPHCMILAEDLPDITRKTIQFIENHG